MRVHGADTGGFVSRIERSCIAPGRVIAAEMSATATPSAAAGKRTIEFGNEIGSIRDKLRVESHNFERASQLLSRQKWR